jgi:hypothetical protein
MQERRAGFAEVELCLSEVDAQREARRCLRCDLEFTAPRVVAQPAKPRAQVVPVA